MNDNIAMFDEFEDVHQLSAVHLGLPRIVVEGMDDKRLFEQFWFTSYMDRVDFVQANELVAGSGCTAVAAAVQKSRNIDQIRAIGLVDRDWLFRSHDWGNLFSLDDFAFDAATKNEDFLTIRRWEIEAYLLEPDLLADLVKSLKRTGPGSAAECAAALGLAITEIESLLIVQRLFVACHVAGIRRDPNYMLHKLSAELEQECEKEMLAFTDADGLAAAATVDPLLQAIVAAAPADEESRWRLLLKFVDTKRLIGRLGKRFNTISEIRWPLAGMMEKSNRRPLELEQRINEFLAA